MLENYIKSSVTQKRLREGLFAPHIEGFANWLNIKGFKALTIEGSMRSLAGWADWMCESDFTSVDDLVSGFEAYKIALDKKRRTYCNHRPNKEYIHAASAYIQFLQESGIIVRPPILPSPIDAWPILVEYCSWSRQHRGIRETTLYGYQDIALALVKSLGDATHAYTAKAIRDFVFNRAKPHGIWRANSIATAVRAFLRFLTCTGRCSVGLVYSVPTYASWKLQSVPRYLEPADVKRVIDACIDKEPYGLRDRAVILLLARLGLRATDIAELSFANIDWKNGRIAVCGKGRRHEWLPLPQDIGDAILRYIKESRPSLKSDRVFTTVKAPLGPLTRCGVKQIAGRAIRRAGVKAPSYGAHVFRHSAATAMLREGVSLAGIGAVLRHRSPSTTAIYAKVDFGLLSEVAQEWPKVLS